MKTVRLKRAGTNARHNRDINRRPAGRGRMNGRDAAKAGGMAAMIRAVIAAGTPGFAADGPPAAGHGRGGLRVASAPRN